MLVGAHYFRGFYATLLLGLTPLWAGEAVSAAEVHELIEQNRLLQKQINDQQAQIDELRTKLTEISLSGTHPSRTQSGSREPQVVEPVPVERAPASSWAGARELRISGEAGLAYFDGGPQSAWPNGEFRADDVKIYLEAPVWKDTYFFAELDLVSREANDEFFHMGEVYVDFENISGRFGGTDRLLNMRVGRFDIPFGEEYLVRGVLDNPLITHSVADIWGVDEGVEFYGEAGLFNYVLAVQNGGHKTLRDFDSDKSIAARLGVDPTGWLHLSASAMRTGDLTVAGDFLSEVWIGGGFFRSIGSFATTQGFNVRLLQADARVHWDGGHVSAAGGTADYDDNDTAADNRRKLRHYYLEAAQQFAGGFVGAVRYSEISVTKGYLLQGLGSPSAFFYSGLPLAEWLSRLSFGLGYRFGDSLLLKFEFAREDGRMLNGKRRNQEDLIATEVGVKF